MSQQNNTEEMTSTPAEGQSKGPKPSRLAQTLTRICANDDIRKALKASFEECIQIAHLQAANAGLAAVFNPDARDNAVACLAVEREYQALLDIIVKLEK